MAVQSRMLACVMLSFMLFDCQRIFAEDFSEFRDLPATNNYPGDDDDDDDSDLVSYGDDDSSATEITCDETYECEEQTLDADWIWCQGYKACQDTTIRATDFVNCLGCGGCKNADVTSPEGIITCNGRAACQSATLTSDTSNRLVCSGERACQAATITTITSSILCFGFGGCQYAEIESQSGDIYCNGDLGCRYADISTSSGTLYVAGERAVYKGSIDDTATVYASGDQSLMYATIKSNGVDDLHIYSTGDESLKHANLYCYEDSNCTVHCETGSSCDGFNFYCESGANCTVACDSDCNNCPNVTSWVEAVDGFVKQEIQTVDGEDKRYAFVDLIDVDLYDGKDNKDNKDNKMYVNDNKYTTKNKNVNNNEMNGFFLVKLLSAFESKMFLGQYFILFTLFYGFYHLCRSLFETMFYYYSQCNEEENKKEQPDFQYQSI